MRVSHFVPLRGTKVNVAREMLSELGIRNGCQLYAVPLDDAPRPTLILSCIPPKAWDRIVRLTVYLSESPGSLSRAAECLSELDVNLLASWTAATTALGEGCWTLIAELPADLLAKDTTEIRGLLTATWEKADVLTSRKEFDTGLDRVVVSPLRVLGNLRKNVVAEREYVGTVSDYTIDLEGFRDATGTKLSDAVLVERYARVGLPVPRYCLATPDTEERYTRLTFLPQQSRMLQIRLQINVLSDRGAFKGYFGVILRELADLGVNIYSADNFMLAKSPGEDGRMGSETVSYVFSVDASRAQVPDSRKETSRLLLQRICHSLDRHAATCNGSCDVAEELFSVRDLEELFPRCYLATNARIGLPEAVYARKLITALRSLGLDPVNVDIATGQTVFEDVVSLLRASPFVVSLHVPGIGNALVDPDAQPQKDDGLCLCCPSDWVLFEESYALGLGRRVFRLRHRGVREPRYAPGQPEYLFDEDTFELRLDALLTAIRTFQTGERYIEAVQRSEEWAREVPVEVIRRSIDQLFFGEDGAGDAPANGRDS